MMKRTAFLFAAALFAVAAHGDDQTRDVQAQLKNQGFFFGEVNGTASDEMTAAIRRFQIRNGLKVTGKADDETLSALGLGAKPTPPLEAPAKPAEPAWEPPAPKKAPQVNPRPAGPEMEDAPPAAPTVRTKPRDLLVRERERDTVPDDVESEPPSKIFRGVPVEPGIVEPPRPIPNATYDPASSIFRGTPYATAPRELQRDTIASAQRILQRERVYFGSIDGIPGQMTSEALFNYQEKYALNRTGRLDMDTIAKMNLLPRVVPAPGARPFYNPNQRRDPTVLRGVWVR